MKETKYKIKIRGQGKFEKEKARGRKRKKNELANKKNNTSRRNITIFSSFSGRGCGHVRMSYQNCGSSMKILSGQLTIIIVIFCVDIGYEQSHFTLSNLSWQHTMENLTVFPVEALRRQLSPRVARGLSHKRQTFFMVSTSVSYWIL